MGRTDPVRLLELPYPKIPQMGHLAETYLLTVLEAGSLKLRYKQGWFLWGFYPWFVDGASFVFMGWFIPPYICMLMSSSRTSLHAWTLKVLSPNTVTCRSPGCSTVEFWGDMTQPIIMTLLVSWFSRTNYTTSLPMCEVGAMFKQKLTGTFEMSS